MAVRIRLKRIGGKKRPYYRFVVADSRNARGGTSIEELGSYDPLSNPSKVQVNAERALYWLKQGAQPSDTVRRLFEKNGVLEKLKEANQE
ncbi:MAG TPA: 30S ribosomal protein S16 [Firmicutes bacterium]|nr:30S ribosomal protein S16 [Bacillota bacterium]